MKGCNGCRFNLGEVGLPGGLIKCSSARHIAEVYGSTYEFLDALNILDKDGYVALLPWEDSGDDEECPQRREAGS